MAGSPLAVPSGEHRAMSNDLRRVGGGGGIRTLERLTPLTVFETAPFNHSGTPPQAAHVRSPGERPEPAAAHPHRGTARPTQHVRRGMYVRGACRGSVGSTSGESTGGVSRGRGVSTSPLRRAGHGNVFQLAGV